LLYGAKNRHIGKTKMNEGSSRSHSVFSLKFKGVIKDEYNHMEKIKSDLNMVDLAGSERQSKTEAEGERLKEGS